MSDANKQDNKIVPLRSPLGAAPVKPDSVTAPDNAAVSLIGLNYAIGNKRFIRDISASIPADGITCFMGPNGAGKTLLMRLMAGLIEPGRGSIQYSEAVANRIAIVFQKPVLLRRTVRENLDHALKIYGVENAKRRNRVNELLSVGGLSGMADRSARALSGGEQQRLGLIRAMAANPKLLLADEPTASLDPAATRAIEALLSEAARSGVKVVLVTHDRGQAARMASDVVFMHKGALIEHCAADQFFDSPRTPEAKAFLAGELLI